MAVAPGAQGEVRGPRGAAAPLALEPAPPRPPRPCAATAGPLPEQRGSVAVRLGLCKGGLLEVQFLGARGSAAWQALLAAVRGVPGAVPGDARDHGTAGGDSWVCPADQYGALLTHLRAANPPPHSIDGMDPLPLRLLQELGARARAAAEAHPRGSEKVPDSVRSRLMDFQREGLEFAVRQGGRVLIGDEMGLGKTVQGLAAAAAFPEDRPCLVVCPSSLRSAWSQALQDWLGAREGERLQTVMATKDGATFWGEYVVASYDFVAKHAERICGCLRPEFVILDESHYIKNHNAKRSKAAVELTRQARRAVLLTGTPALNRPIELYQQLRALHPKVFPHVKPYGERYCKGGFQFGMYRGASNTKELHNLLHSGIMIRRLKKDVLTQLPPKQRQAIHLFLDPKARQILRELNSELKELGSVAQDGPRPDAAQREHQMLLNKLYLATADTKKSAVVEYLSVLLENEQKFIVFAHHKLMIEEIDAALRRKKVQFIRIDGSTPAQERGGRVKKFQEDGNVLVALLSFGAAAEGLTLTAASTVVMAELVWKAGQLVQAEDRAHRVGQVSSVNIHYLLADGSVDDIVWRSVQNKLELVGRVLNGVEDNLELQREGKQEGPGTATESPASRWKRPRLSAAPLNQPTLQFPKIP